MARWKLTAGHYLRVTSPVIEWEYKELNDLGRMAKKVYAVPLYLNPDDSADCNYPGEIIVAQGVGALPRDIIFLGAPTPDMLPLDAEAQALSDAESPKWVHPVETLDGTAAPAFDLNQALRDLASLTASAKPSGMVPKEEFDELKEMVTALMVQNAALKVEGGRRL